MMENNELLQNILEETRKQNKSLRRLLIAMCAVFLVVALFFTYLFSEIHRLSPHIDALAEQSQSVMGEMEVVLTQLDDITAQLARADLEGVVEKLNGIDLETLNGSIESLYKIVEPLSRLFSR